MCWPLHNFGRLDGLPRNRSGYCAKMEGDYGEPSATSNNRIVLLWCNRAIVLCNRHRGLRVERYAAILVINQLWPASCGNIGYRRKPHFWQAIRCYLRARRVRVHPVVSPANDPGITIVVNILVRERPVATRPQNVLQLFLNRKRPVVLSHPQMAMQCQPST